MDLVGSINKPESLNALTSLRFFAAFAVVIHHLQAFNLNVSKYVWGVSFGVAVSFFFVLSGFVLSHAYAGKLKLGQYYWNRVFRIWPLHLTTLILVLLVLSPRNELRFMWGQLLLIHSWFPTYASAFSFNSVSWTVSIEWFFYLIFPFLIGLKTRLLMLVWALFLAANLAFLTAFSLYPNLLSGIDSGLSANTVPQLFPPMRLLEFVGGIVAYRLFTSLRLGKRKATIAQLVVCGIFLLYLTVHMTVVGWISEFGSTAFTVAYRQYGMTPLFLALVIVFAYNDGLLARLIGAKVLVYLGEVSFAIYMTHQIILRWIIESGFYAQYGSETSAFLAVVVILVVSIACYHFIETTCRSFGRRYIQEMSRKALDNSRAG